MMTDFTNGPRIALLVDNPYRDLPGLVLLSWGLCQKGATVYLIPMNLRIKEIWPLVPDFVLLNHFRTIYEKLVSELIDANIPVGVLDTEGSVFSPVPSGANILRRNSNQVEEDVVPAMEEYALSMARDRELRHNIACYLAWTPLFAKYAARADWYRPEQITVTGIPRMDFYAPQWNKAALAMSSYIDSYPEPIILINSNFTLANPRFQSPEKEAETMITKFAYDPGFVRKWQENQQRAMQKLASLANSMAKRFPDVTFIFRPHPFENEETYEDLLSSLSNLRVVKEGTVDGWLLRARALIHWASSTAIDSCLAGVPAFTADWIPIHLPIPAVEEVSINCSTEEELAQHLTNILDGNFKLPSKIAENIDKVVEDTYYKIDGLAHERAADTILKTIDSRKFGTSKKTCRNFVYQTKNKGPETNLTTFARKTLSLSPHWSFRKWKNVLGKLPWDSSDKYFDSGQVRTMVAAIEKCASPEPKESRQKIRVMPSRERGDYHFGYLQGRSVTVFPDMRSKNE